MAINPINLNPGQLQVPQVDFSALGNLFSEYQQGKANQFKIGEAERRQGALAELSKLNPNDPNYAQQVAALAFRLGDVSAGISAINNAAELKLKREEAEREADIGRRFSSQPGAPATTPAAPQAVPPAPSLVAPGVPGLGTQPGEVPTLARPPTVTSAIQQPPTTQTPPVMAQRGAPGGGPTVQPNFAPTPQAPVRVASTDPGAGVAAAVAAAQQPWTIAQMQGARRIDQIAPTLRNPFEAMMRDAPESVRRELSMTDSFRTYAEQADLKRRKPHLAAAPGHSRHELGEAFDLAYASPATKAWVHANAGKYGLGFPMAHEPWHIEPMTARGPGTVAASVQGRGPISTGAGGGAIASASPGVLSTPMARTQVAALDPSFTPQTSMTDAGPQLPAGVSPAAPAAQGAAGPPILPSPTPLVPPNISLAALGSPPAGGVGAIGPMGGPAVDAMPPQPLQMAQAAQGAPGPYRPPFQVPPMQQAAPTLPVRPPVQQPPAVAPPAAVAARGPASGSPLEHVSNADLIAASGSKRWGEMARAELARRSTVAGEANKMPADWQTFLRAKEAGFKGDYIEFQQAQKADTTLARNYAAIVKDREARGLGPPEGGFEKFVADNKPGPTFNIGDKAELKREEAVIKRMEAFSEAGTTAADNKQLIGAMRGLNVDTGFSAAVRAKLGEFGINTQGLDDIQAMSSLIDRLTPTQRVPGSGSTSDFDARTFKSALPSLMRQPGGNAIILNVLESLADNHAARGAIADNYLAGELTAKEAMKQVRDLQKDAGQLGREAVRLARGAPASTGTGGGWTKPEGVSDEDWAAAQKFLPKKGQ